MDIKSKIENPSESGRLSFHHSYQESLDNVCNLLDPENKGIIDLNEVVKIFQEINWEEKDPGLEKLIEQIQSKPQHVTLNEFAKTVVIPPCNFSSIENSKATFELFEDNKSGYISIESLRQTCKKFGIPQSQEQLLAMVQAADINGDFLISLEEFHRVMKD